MIDDVLSISTIRSEALRACLAKDKGRLLASRRALVSLS